MCMIFRMEDLVASAFIGLFEKGLSSRKISIQRLDEYKKNVIKALNEKEKIAVIPTSRDYTAMFLFFFDDYFSYEKNKETDDYICLEQGKTLQDLKRAFGIFIPDDVRCFFEDEKNLEPIFSGVG